MLQLATPYSAMNLSRPRPAERPVATDLEGASLRWVSVSASKHRVRTCGDRHRHRDLRGGEAARAIGSSVAPNGRGPAAPGGRLWPASRINQNIGRNDNTMETQPC